MLRIVPPSTFTAPATVSVPGGADVQLQITWRHKGQRAFSAWVANVAASPSDAAFLDQVITDWAGVGDADGRPLPYSPSALADLLDAYPASGRQLLQAYRSALLEAREKN